jgi:hypothetical protein
MVKVDRAPVMIETMGLIDIKIVLIQNRRDIRSERLMEGTCEVGFSRT